MKQSWAHNNSVTRIGTQNSKETSWLAFPPLILCWQFLWIGKINSSRKALVAWKQVRFPKKEGGLGIIDIYQWNKVAVGKLLWNLCCKKDILWVKWVHSIYLSSQPLWLFTSVHKCSWYLQQIFKLRSHF